MIKQKMIFIAGKYRGKTSWDIECNIRKAETNALFLARMTGLIPVCVHSMYRFFQDELPDSFWLDATLNILDRCDGILMVDGWENSEGAKAEHKFATEKGIPVFLSIGALIRYYSGDQEGDRTEPFLATE
jgi:hypothetical protein